MQPIPNHFGFPDQGFWLISQYRGNPEVAAEVARIRRPDGAIVRADLQGYNSPKKGPLNVLLLVTSLEALTLRVWADSGFGMMQRRSMAGRAEKVCESEGVVVAAGWVIENSTKSLSVGLLADQLDADRMISVQGFEDVVNQRMNDSMRKWKR